MTALVVPTDPRRSSAGTGALRALADATVLAPADVRTALALGRLVGPDRPGAPPDEVLLAAALAVRAVRLGHVYVDLASVATTAAPDDESVAVDLAALPWPNPAAWPEVVAASPLVAAGEGPPDDRPLRLAGTRCYLDRYWRHERAIAADLLARAAAGDPPVDVAVLADGVDRLFPDHDTGHGVDLQRVAAAAAVGRRWSVIAGGPGTGKTTTVARVLALLHEQAAALGAPPPRVALAAPTGKAAARLAEAVRGEAASLAVADDLRATLAATGASTIHRLLGWNRSNHSRPRHDGSNPLPHDAVVIDESSMVSLSQMARLLDAVRPDARLVLVGDPRQLASVEAGAVLGDVVGPAASGLRMRPAAAAALGAAVGRPVEVVGPGAATGVGDGIVVLRKVHRFGDAIGGVAAAIEAGDADATVAALTIDDPAVRFVTVTPDAQPSTVAELAGVRRAVVEAGAAVVAAAAAGDGPAALSALRSVQVLCAHRRGPAGAARWRTEIERWLRASMPGYGTGTWYAGRPLLVTENDYGLGVFNGDTGVVIDTGGGRLRAVFERQGDILEVRPTRLASVDSLYAITIHKAQGSQFGAVVVVLPDPDSPVLTRELLYTAVTRAQRSLTVVGTEATIRAGVDRPVARASGLGEALWGAPGPGS